MVFAATMFSVSKSCTLCGVSKSFLGSVLNLLSENFMWYSLFSVWGEADQFGSLPSSLIWVENLKRLGNMFTQRLVWAGKAITFLDACFHILWYEQISGSEGGGFPSWVFMKDICAIVITIKEVPFREKLSEQRQSQVVQFDLLLQSVTFISKHNCEK